MQEAGETMEVNGQPLRFPEHEIPKAVDYSLQGLYGNIYHDIIDAIEHLNFAVYRLDEYGVETGEKETSAQLRQRNANFVGIMRTILLQAHGELPRRAYVHCEESWWIISTSSW